jgi:flagellar protein FlgJ
MSNSPNTSLISSTADAQNFLDLNGLNSIRQQSNSTNKASKEAALQTAAKQFEAIFMQMLMKSMRKAQEVLESDSPFNSESTKFYRDMHDQQMSLELSQNGSLGLSDLIVRQLGGDSENFTPNSLLISDQKHSLNQNVKNTGHSIENKGLGIDQNDRQTDRQTNDSAQHNIPQRLSYAFTKTPENPSIPFSINALQAPEFNQPKDFVTALTEDAKRVQEKLNVPFEVVIAQAALETGWGQKIIKNEAGESSNNLFNIKADKRWQGEQTNKETLEFEQGAMVKKREPFRVYDSIGESINDYMNFLSTSDRYKEALNKADNVEHFLHNLQSAGYATDPNYAKKIMGTLRTVTGLLNN